MLVCNDNEYKEAAQAKLKNIYIYIYIYIYIWEQSCRLYDHIVLNITDFLELLTDCF
jgi:hypothetical protein